MRSVLDLDVRGESDRDINGAAGLFACPKLGREPARFGDAPARGGARLNDGIRGRLRGEELFAREHRVDDGGETEDVAPRAHRAGVHGHELGGDEAWRAD